MKRMIRLLVAVTILASLAAPASSGGANGSDGCTKREGRQVVKRFVSSYNAGDVEKLDRIFAKQVFLTYMVNPMERPSPMAEDRGTLMGYFEARHEQGDRFGSLELRVGRNQNYPGEWGMNVALERASQDVTPTIAGRFAGKGLIGADCRIRAWRMSWQGP